uniref:Uncharacterized protein n=1 Tax=Fagus sylvatica TaxID=28930 RepID=A0A2N9IDN3_FAGSY
MRLNETVGVVARSSRLNKAVVTRRDHGCLTRPSRPLGPRRDHGCQMRPWRLKRDRGGQMRPWKPRRDRGGQMRPLRLDTAVGAETRPWRSNEAVEAARGRFGFLAPQGGLYHGHSYPGDLGRCSYLPSSRSFKLLKVLLTAPVLVRFFAPQGGLYHGHSYPGDLGRCSYLPSSRSFKLLKVLLTTPVLVRFFAPQGGLYHGHSYPGDLGRCSYLPSSRSFKLLKVLLTAPVLVRPVRVRSGSVPAQIGSVRLVRLGPGSVPARISSDPACAWRALACAWHALAHAGMCWAWGDRRSFHRRVAAPMRPFFTPFFRSGDEDPDGGIHCSIRCPEEWVLETVGTAARGGAWSFLAGALTGAWRRVRAPMVVIFLGFDRSGDDLLDGSPHSIPNSLYRFPQTAPIVLT